MFLEVERESQSRPRYPILILDAASEEAYLAGSAGRQPYPYRAARSRAVYGREECVEAERAGGVIVVSQALNPGLRAWIEQIGSAGSRVFAILITPGGAEPVEARQAARDRVRELSQTVAALFPVMTEEIEERVNCSSGDELRLTAQGFATLTAIDALEHLGSRVGEGTFDSGWLRRAMDRPGPMAATSILCKPGVPTAVQVRHLADRLFWPAGSIDRATQVVGRIEVPAQMSERLASEWQAALEALFANADVSFSHAVCEPDAPARVSVLLPNLPLASRVKERGTPDLTPVNGEGMTCAVPLDSRGRRVAVGS